MSNETIVARLRDLCIKFADEKASLEELQEGITAHGRALEGMDNEWNQLMDDIDATIEMQLYMGMPKNNYQVGIDVATKLADYFEWQR